MSFPTPCDWEALKTLARYLTGKPRLQIWFEHQAEPESLTVYIDSDWAGCKRSRKSTSGGAMLICGHGINVWSKTHGIIENTSAEAELYGLWKVLGKP